MSVSKPSPFEGTYKRPEAISSDNCQHLAPRYVCHLGSSIDLVVAVSNSTGVSEHCSVSNNLPLGCQGKSRTALALRADYSAVFLARPLPEALPAAGKVLSISSALAIASRNSEKESTDKDTPRFLSRI